MKIAEPKNRKELRSFIGIVNSYRDMWIRRSHVLAPLASLTSKKTKCEWGPQQSAAFATAKKIIAREVLLAYPDFSKKFVIHTDASHYQLGAVISQDGKPIAFYSRKLNPAQTWYTTKEQELLSIVETLKEYRNILLGHEIELFTDHQNLVYKHFNTERVMRWRLLIEELAPS
jgi:RNase H-like domain found in reverse transcriptase